MAARLTRAKKRLASSGIPFATPPAARLDERLDVVATVVYLAFTSGYHPGVGDSPLRVANAAECVQFERESFGALHQMMSGLSEAERTETWQEIAAELGKFEGTQGFAGPCEMLVGAGTK